jgi:poly(3-hydroxybutyrate) depolymerase
MTLPSQPGRTPAIYKPAAVPTSDPAHGAAFIFLHGLGDSAEGLESKSPINYSINAHLTFR